jgi:hypothetical protein
MSELVNPVSAAQLQHRNQEPTHLGGQAHDDLGGQTPETEPNTAKIDAAKGVKGQDTSIPRSVAAEPSHLKAVVSEVEKDVDVKFDDEMKAEDVDDLDKALDEAMDDAPAKVDVKVGEEADDDDEKKMAEEADDEKAEKMHESADADADDVKKEEADDEKKMAEEADDEKKMAEEADDEKKEKVEEALAIRVKLPKANIFESAGFDAKQQKHVAAIFESAIKDTTKQVSVKLNEHYKARYAQKLAESESKLTDRLNTYLSVVVETWMEENRVNVRKNLRTELAENFLNGLQSLFKDNYIDVPESKVNVVETLTSRVESLEQKLNEEHAKNMKLRRLAETANKKRIVAEFARTMSETQAAKLAKLAENTEYVDAKDFREKLSMLKESYFGGAKETKMERLPEENVQVVAEKTNTVKSEADAVADAISRQVKSNW